MKNRVVVTGIGAIASAGSNKEEVFEACVRGINGIKPSEKLKKLGANSHYAAIIPTEGEMTHMEKFMYICQKALAEMFQDGKIHRDMIARARSAFFLGTANLPSLSIEDQYDRLYQENTGIDGMSLNYRNSEAIYALNDQIGNRGDCYYINSACASGTMAAGAAYDLIKAGEIDMAVAAGADILSEVSIAGFHSMNNMCKEPCKPFDKNRSGMNLGEAAAFLLLESEAFARARGADIYGEIFGYDSRNDAYHITSPEPGGEMAFRCMDNVLKQYPLQKEETVYLNTHGTGTVANDEMELKAICRLAEERKNLDTVWFSSSKSVLGHCLGAAGAIELAMCMLGLRQQKMPLSVSVEHKMDMPESIRLVTRQEESRPFDVCISNSFAFAGNLASIGICKYKEDMPQSI